MNESRKFSFVFTRSFADWTQFFETAKMAAFELQKHGKIEAKVIGSLKLSRRRNWFYCLFSALGKNGQSKSRKFLDYVFQWKNPKTKCRKFKFRRQQNLKTKQNVKNIYLDEQSCLRGLQWRGGNSLSSSECDVATLKHESKFSNNFPLK